MHTCILYTSNLSQVLSTRCTCVMEQAESLINLRLYWYVRQINLQDIAGEPRGRDCKATTCTHGTCIIYSYSSLFTKPCKFPLSNSKSPLFQLILIKTIDYNKLIGFCRGHGHCHVYSHDHGHIICLQVTTYVWTTFWPRQLSPFSHKKEYTPRS
jgi:hypothetical protein